MSSVLPGNRVRHLLGFFQSRSMLNWLFLSVSLILLVASVTSFLFKSRNDVRERAGMSLRESLLDMHGVIREIWVRRQQDLIKELAANPSIIEDTEKLMKKTSNPDELLKLSLASEAHKIATQTTRINGILDMTVISPDFINIVSASERITAKPSLVSKNFPDRMQKVFGGNTLMMPPIKVDHVSPEGNDTLTRYLPYIFFCTPLHDTNGGVIAVLTVRCDPREELDVLTRTSNAGIAGEVYLVDSFGRMITESQFNPELQALGLLRLGEKSALNVDVKEVNPNRTKKISEPPFTHSASEVMDKKSGFTTESYYNYVGDRVFGAWLWDEEMGVGFIAEIEESKAMIPYKDTFKIAIGLGGVIAVIAFAMLLGWKRLTVDANNKNQQRLTIATESAGIYVWEVAILPDKTYKLNMEKGHDIFGLSSSGDRMLEITDHTHPEDKTASLKALLEYLSGKRENFYVEFRYRSPGEHNYKWLSSYGKILNRYPNGAVRTLLMVSQDINKRKQIEEVVRDERGRLQVMLDSSPVSFAIVSQGKIQLANPQFQKTFGRKAGDAIDPMFADLSDRERLRELVESEKLNNFEVQFLNAQGDPIDGLITGHSRDIGDGVVTIIWIVDITHRKQSERQLALLNDIVYGGLESANIGAWWIDTAEDNIFHALNKTAELLGLPINPEKVYPTDQWINAINAASARFSASRNIAAEVSEKIEGVVTGKYSDVEVTYPIYRPDGTMSWLNVRTYVPARNAKGIAKMLVGVIIDVTTQKEAEESVRKEQERFKFSLEAVGAHYWTSNMLTGETAYTSDLLYTQNGYSEEEVPAASHAFFDSFVHPDDIPQIWEAWGTFLQGKAEDYHCEFRMKKKDGSWIWLMNRAHVINWDEEGKPVTAGGITLDITDRKNSEIALMQAKEDAVLATKSKSEFLARMSHEIRTPMNAIIGITFLTMQTPLTKKQSDNLKKVHDSGVSLLGIINDILDFSKIEAGKLALEESDFDLENVFSDLANVVTYKAHEKGLEVIFDLQPTLPAMLVGDALRLKQILINLVNNAIKFTSTGEVVVRTKKSKMEEDRIVILFSIKDTGIGLSEEEIEKLFQSFTQADNSTTRRYGGTGLGLSICKSLVEMLGGEIWIESEKGKGSTFFFTAGFRLSADQKSRDLKPPVNLRGMNVLVCDDNETAAKVVREMLEGFTFKVTVTKSGKEAIRELEKNKVNPYALVFMDWNMPEMDGVQALREIAANTNIHPSPVSIMLTSYNRQDVFMAAEEAGVKATLVKPISCSTLFDTIISAFDKNSVKSPGLEMTTISAEFKASLKDKLVLLVEDNLVNQDVAVGMLEEVGVRAEVAENGEVAIRMIIASGVPSKYQAVLMDLRMPVMDGYDATRAIRKMEEYNSLPVIAMTADAISGIRETCLEIGMNDFINKPISPQQFYATLVKWIGQGTSSVSSAPILSSFMEIPEIPGVNVNARFNRFGSDKAYLRFLSNFEKHFHDFVPKLKAELDAGEIERAERMVHDLKGLSGMLDAGDLHAFAVEFDNKLRQNTEFNIDQQVAQLSGLLDPILTVIKPIVERFRQPNADPGTVSIELNVEEAMKKIEQLRDLLQSSDFKSAVVSAQLSTIPGISKFQDEINEVSEWISEYDFEAALTALEKLVQAIKQ